MQIEIPEDVVRASGLSKDEILRILAVTLYDREHLSVGYASQLANLSKSEFLDLLAAQGVEFKYDAEDLKKDLKSLKDLKLVCSATPLLLDEEPAPELPCPIGIPCDREHPGSF